MTESELEGLDGQEQQRTSTASQETVVQASGVARYAQAAENTTGATADRSSGVDAGP